MTAIFVASAGRGAAWLLDGFDYFKNSAPAWLGVAIILLIATAVATFIPLAGLVLQLLTPVFTGGLMLGCRHIDQGGHLSLNHLFAGFTQETGKLILLGVLYSAGIIFIMILCAGLVFTTLGMGVVQAAISGDPAIIIANIQNILLAVLTGMLFYLPLIMAFWFAPALVVLDGEDAFEAMKNSFKGCLKNFIPFLIYGVAGLVLSLLATITLMLGWFILLPMIIASVYLAYKDIYQTGPVAIEAGV